MNPSGESKNILIDLIGLDNLSGVAAILRYSLPGIDDIVEEDIDIDELINQENDEEEEEEKKEDKKKKPTFDEI